MQINKSATQLMAFGVTVIGRFGSVFLAFITTVFISHNASKSDAGAYFALLSILPFAILLTGLGLNTVFSSVLAVHEFRVVDGISLKTLFFIIKTTLASSFLCLVLAIPVSVIWLSGGGSLDYGFPLVAMVIGAAFFQNFSLISGELLRYYKYYKSAALSSGFFSNLIFLALVFIFFYYLGGRLEMKSMTLFYFLASSFSGIGYFLFILFSAEASNKQAVNLRNALSLSVPALITNTGAYFLMQATSVVVAFFENPDSVAQYGASFRLIMLLLILPGVIQSISISEISRSFADGNFDKAIALAKSSARVSAFLVLPFALAYLFFGKDILGLVFGGKYQEHVHVLSILALGAAINVSRGFPGVCMLLSGNGVLQAKITVIGGVVSLLLTVLFVRIWGIYGASFAYLCAILLQGAMEAYYARIKIGSCLFPDFHKIN